MFFLFFLVLFSVLFSEKQLADGVLAVVGDHVVLVSDVLEETNLLAQQKNVSPQNNPYLYDKLFNRTLERQINNKVVLNFALLDSNLYPSYEETKRVLDDRVSFYVNQFGSVSAFEKAINMSVGEMKEKNLASVKNEILIEKFKNKEFSGIFITKKEVFSYYEEQKDSLVSVPELGSFSLLEKKTKPSKEKKHLFLKELTSLRDSLVLGLLDFTDVVNKRSQDPSVSTNGGIMTTVRGDLVLAYEKAAYSLEVGALSSLVETSFGFHLIKLLEKRGEKITTQHALFTLNLSEDDYSSSFSFLDSLRFSLENDPGTFDSLSISSQEPLSGFYERKPLASFPSFVISFIKQAPSFSFSEVVTLEGSCFLVYKYSYSETQRKNLENSWFEIEELALDKKKKNLFDLWIKNKKESLFVKTNSF